MKNIVKLVLLLLPIVGLAQQRPQYSNYVMNNYILNPAVGGSYTYWNAKVGHREQWLGMEGAPSTSFVSVQGPIGHPEARKRTIRYKEKGHHGIGAYAYFDQIGPLTWSGAFASYSYHVRLSRKYTLSTGAFVGLKEFRINGDEIKFVEHEQDNLVNDGVNSTILPDGSLGAFLYSQEMFVGVSINQIFQSSLNYQAEDGEDPEGKLNNHYFITAGYKFALSTTWHFSPSVMIKYMRPAPATFDFNFRFLYEDFLWFGVLYRNKNAMSFTAEYVINDMFEIGYAYDYDVFNQLRNYNNGTHEIILGIRWNDPEKSLHCPAKFW